MDCGDLSPCAVAILTCECFWVIAFGGLVFKAYGCAEGLGCGPIPFGSWACGPVCEISEAWQFKFKREAACGSGAGLRDVGSCFLEDFAARADEVLLRLSDPLVYDFVVYGLLLFKGDLRRS